MPKLQIIGPADPVNLPNASPESFGAGVGRAMQETGRVGQALGQVLQQVIDSKAKSAAVQYEQELSAAANEISLDPDITKRGEKFEAAQRSLQERYRPKLGNRGLYDSTVGLATMELRTKFDHKTMLDGIEESVRNTEMTVQHKALKAATAESEEEMLTLFQEIQNDLKAGELYLTPGQQDQMFQKSIGIAVRAMVDNDPQRALDVIDKFGTYLEPAAISVWKKEAALNLKAAQEQGAAEQFNAAVMQNVDKIMAISGTKEGRLALTAQISDPKLSQEVGRRIKLMSDNEKAAETRARKAVVDGVWDQLFAGAGPEVIPVGLPTKDEKPMREYAAARAASAAKGHDFNPKTDEKTWGMLWKIREKDPETFKDLNLPAYRMHLSNSHYGELEQEQRNLIGGGAGDKASPSGIGTFELVRKNLRSAKIKLPEETQASLELQIDQSLKDAQSELGRPLEWQEKDKIALDHIAQIDVQDGGFWFFDKTKRVYDLTADDREKIIAAPPAWMIEEAQRALGPDADDEMISNAIDEWLTVQGVPNAE